MNLSEVYYFYNLFLTNFHNKRLMKRLLHILCFVLFLPSLIAQGDFMPAENTFRQMGPEFATPNAFRNAAGAPGSIIP